MLELGPGTGLQALHVAPQLGPDGRLDIVDVQQEMLDHVMRRVQEEVQAGRNAAAAIVPHCADARELPFDDGVFDAVYLVTALGETPEPLTPDVPVPASRGAVLSAPRQTVLRRARGAGPGP